MWEQRYAESDQIWSGRPNARLVEVVSGLSPGTALELGCGEGGDTVWLARQGWRVLAVDIANNALRRAAAALAAAGDDLVERVEFQQHDLTATFPSGCYDLVSAHFLHSPTEWDRDSVLRRAAEAVAPGGRLLIVDHAEGPPWSEGLHDHVFPTAEEVVAGLELDPAYWERERVERAERDGVGPDGQVGTLVDNVILLRRL